VEEYSLRIKPSASKELQGIPGKGTLSRLIERIRSLAKQPRPQGAEKLAGRQHLYRIRQGDYRVIYSINEQDRVVDVIKIGHRRDVYR
jgi:mRNA interferase RelE/StbE